MVKLITVHDKFEIEGKGLVLTGFTDDDRMRPIKGSIAYIRQPKLKDLETEVLDFELFRNTWSPHKQRNIAILFPKSISIDSIELNSEVWCNIH